MKAHSEAKANQRKKHNVEKVHSVAYNAFADNTSIVNRLAVVAYQNLRNPAKIRTYSNSRSSILVPMESA